VAAQFVVDFASADCALDCYIVYNEYLLHNDPNRSISVPLVDSTSFKQSQCIRTEDITSKLEHSGHASPAV
jgi:hypothetical protein